MNPQTNKMIVIYDTQLLAVWAANNFMTHTIIDGLSHQQNMTANMCSSWRSEPPISKDQFESMI
jgi:hypothetical protein